MNTNNTQDRIRGACGTIAALFLLLAFQHAYAFDVTGTTTDTAGKPVPAARVWLCQDRTVRHTDTDAAGAFAFSGVAPRPIALVAYKDGFAFGGQTAPVIGSGAVALILEQPATLAIRIENESFEPVAGAFIRHLCVSGTFDVPVSDLDADGFPPMRSGADGLLHIPALPQNGHVRFVAGHRDYADSSVAYLPVSDKVQPIILYPGVKLRGRVTSKKGDGVAHACVSVLRLGSGAQRVAAETLTDPDGYYHVTVVPDHYCVAASHPGYASPHSTEIDAGQDEKKNTVDLVLETPRTITGMLHYPDGKPCPGAPVSYWIGGESYTEVLTQVDGRFELCTPPVAGSLRVVPPEGYETEYHGDITIAADNPDRLPLDPMALKALPCIEGHILNPDGQPESHVLIATQNLAPPLWALPGPDGHFRIILQRVPAGRTIAFRAEHAERFWRADFQVSLDEPKPATVTLGAFEPNIKASDAPPGDNAFEGMTGEAAPEIVCDAWFNTPPLTLQSLKKKVVVLLFWGGFDARSAGRSTIEELRALHTLLKDDTEVAIVGVHDGGKEAPEIERYAKEYGIAFPVGRDAEPFQTFGKYGIHYIPQIVLIDKHGTLRYVSVEGRLLELIKTLRREG